MLWFFAAAFGLLGLWSLLYWRWRKGVLADIAEGGGHIHAKMAASEPELMAGLTRETFDAIYRRVHFPRYPGYVLAAAATFVASLPVTFALLTAGVLLADRFGLAPNAVNLADRYLVEDGRMRVIRDVPPEAAIYWLRDVGGFYFFFGVVLSWIAIFWFYMRRYHARRPGHLRDEILKRGRPAP